MAFRASFRLDRPRCIDLYWGSAEDFPILDESLVDLTLLTRSLIHLFLHFSFLGLSRVEDKLIEISVYKLMELSLESGIQRYGDPFRQEKHSILWFLAPSC